MKFRFLGTAAAEAWPALFCNCPQCVKARERGGRDIRTRSQSLLDEHILIDFPCDTYKHALDNNLDLSAVDLLLITHGHSDHMYPCDLGLRHAPYGHNPTVPELHIASGHGALERMKKSWELFGESISTLVLHELRAFEPFEYNGTRVIPIPAYHMLTDDAFCYSIETGGKRILYLHDTGERIIKQLDKLSAFCAGTYDLVSYDCCYCTNEASEDNGHMGLANNVRVHDCLVSLGLLDAHTLEVVNHFSHNIPAMYDDISEKALQVGMRCSFDGMTVEI